MTKLNWCVAILKKWIEKKKTGNVQINFFKGGISSINQVETLKYEDDVLKEYNRDAVAKYKPILTD